MTAGSGAERDGDRQPLAPALGDGVVGVGVLVDLPVHADGTAVVALQAVHAEVAGAGLGVLGVGEPEVEEDAAVVGPGVQPGQQVEVDLVALEHDLLARRALDHLRRHRAQLAQLVQRLAHAAEARPAPRA